MSIQTLHTARPTHVLAPRFADGAFVGIVPAITVPAGAGAWRSDDWTVVRFADGCESGAFYSELRRPRVSLLKPHVGDTYRNAGDRADALV